MSTLEYFLFPHTVLSEDDFRHMSVLIPHLHLLQAARAPDVPGWADPFFSAMPTISDEQDNQVRALLKEYKNFASLVGNGAMLASVTHLTEETNRRESRFRIQSTIKGRGEQGQLQPTEVAILEAALFLEMARDLDQQGIELETDVARARSLEKEFRDILGIAGEDDLEEPLEIGDAALAPETSYLTFMLKKRMAFWLRLFSAEASGKSPILVTIAPEVVDEIVDPLMSVANLVNKPATGMSRMSLASIPSLSWLDGEQFQELMEELKGSDIMQAYQKSLENVLRDPKGSSAMEELKQAAAHLRSRLAVHSEENEDSGHEQASLSLTLIESLTLEDLWKGLDKEGFQALGGGKGSRQPLLILSCTTSSVGEATE